MMSESIKIGGYAATRYVLQDGAELVYVPNFLSSGEKDALWEACQRLNWEHQRIMGTPTLRANAWLAPDPAWTYSYSGKLWLPQPLPAAVQALATRLRDLTTIDFTTGLATDYPDGRAGVSWHADGEPEFGENPAIASVSLGEARTFQVLHRSKKAAPGAKADLEIELADGSLLLMLGTFQSFYRHALKKAGAAKGRRINLSFRRYLGPITVAARSRTA
jgi:alkylated DNA repair dioxygenase AlkB